MSEIRKELVALLKRGEIFQRVAKLIALLVDAVSFVCAVCVHEMVGYLARLLFHAEFPLVVRVLEALFAVAFSAVYVQLTFDMVKVFVPWLSPRQQAEPEPKSNPPNELEEKQ